MKGLEGSTLGRYELRHRIAQGGMSEVYLAYDRRVRRQVAVKVLYGSDEPFVRRFEREALAVGTLSNDHILPLYDFGEQRPWYYLVMPYISGCTLRDYLLKRERLTLEEAGSFLAQIAQALQYAHDHNVVHRDVKPSNILLRPDGHAYLVDFGLAKAKVEAESVTRAGTMVGTPEYMAPELLNGVHDYRSDIYSLGIMLYQMLTGRVPFSADLPVAISLKHIQAQPPPPREFNRAIPPAVEAVILKALAKNPDDRYQEARALADAYTHALKQATEEIAAGMWEDASHSDCADTTTSSKAGEDAEVQQAVALAEKKALLPVVTRPLLYPLQVTSLPIPPTVYVGSRRTKKYALPLSAALLCLLLTALIILPQVRWQGQQSQLPTPTHSTKKQTPTPPTHPWETATAVAGARIEATLAAQARVQATAGITEGIGAGTILYANDMTSSGGGWINDGHQCYFSPQGYHVSTSLAHALAWCYSNQTNFATSIITAQGELLYGDLFGLMFRLNPASKTFYALEINSAGSYRFVRAQKGSNPLNWLTLIDWTPSSAIVSGFGHFNTFLILASGNTFRFYINQQLIVTTFTDTAYSSGALGFLVGGDSNGGCQAIFRNVFVFQKQ